MGTHETRPASPMQMIIYLRNGAMRHANNLQNIDRQYLRDDLLDTDTLTACCLKRDNGPLNARGIQSNLPRSEESAIHVGSRDEAEHE
ncbi:unnamed protein product [Pieris brassicae]|uniref:Uncharacterized protein n=1 Tax=Pieris brassicae TaxID=7116 RepID=A0A9P0TSK2_PIEBR|nr:unnamed protein product [Pieris brassicae]